MAGSGVARGRRVIFWREAGAVDVQNCSKRCVKCKEGNCRFKAYAVSLYLRSGGTKY